ncbi:hypothetical protein JCM10908_001461 [Rhodotorula pacifica]|uniref:uncharacterized protein n=1 Tax=Rhodotorula pacifica TaxID=1495444 RepID=UPI00317CB573
MPGLVTPLEAVINFAVPKAELSSEQQARISAKFDIDDPVPSRKANVPIFDLRAELDAGMGGRDAAEQLDERGYAVIKNTSEVAPSTGLTTVEATEAYKEECCRLFEDLLGASKVIAWNAVVRDAGEGQPDVKGTQQMKVEKEFASASSLKAVAGFAHVDQDDVYARTIIKRAAGDDVFEKYSRLQIINIWRPLRGPVTNNPLAVCDFSTLDVEKDILHMAGSYGTAYGVSTSPSQRWGYVSNMMPDEAYLLRCYDSNQGRDGEALYAGHVACSVLNEPKDGGGVEVPRRSVEVRLFVLHE